MKKKQEEEELKKKNTIKQQGTFTHKQTMNNEPPPKYIIPDITPYDLEMVQAKTKIKINWSPEVHDYGKFDAFVRLQFGLNREITRKELSKIEWEENNK